jgi:hypothetical protein
VSPVEGGELLAVDSAHSNIVRITPPLSECMLSSPPPQCVVCFILFGILHCTLYVAHVVCFCFLVDSGQNVTIHTCHEYMLGKFQITNYQILLFRHTC